MAPRKKRKELIEFQDRSPGLCEGSDKTQAFSTKLSPEIGLKKTVIVHANPSSIDTDRTGLGFEHCFSLS